MTLTRSSSYPRLFRALHMERAEVEALIGGPVSVPIESSY